MELMRIWQKNFEKSVRELASEWGGKPRGLGVFAKIFRPLLWLQSRQLRVNAVKPSGSDRPRRLALSAGLLGSCPVRPVAEPGRTRADLILRRIQGFGAHFCFLGSTLCSWRTRYRSTPSSSREWSSRREGSSGSSRSSRRSELSKWNRRLLDLGSFCWSRSANGGLRGVFRQRLQYKIFENEQRFRRVRLLFLLLLPSAFALHTERLLFPRPTFSAPLLTVLLVRIRLLSVPDLCHPADRKLWFCSHKF